MKVAPAAADTFNAVKDKVVEAAKVGQEAASDAVKATKEYAAAGAQKTQEVFNEYVLPTAQAGIEKTQEVYNEYVAPTAAAGKKQQFFYYELIHIILFRC